MSGLFPPSHEVSETDPLLNAEDSEVADGDVSREGNLYENGRPRPVIPDDSSPDIEGRDQRNVFIRIATAMYSFFVMGLIQSSVGVMIPHLEEYYGLTDTLVSLTFLITPLGYFLAAYLNSFIHLRLGQRGIATIGPLCQVIFAVATSMHPPYALFLVASAIGGFGTGLLDGSWCAWTGGMDNANTVQGFLHGSYSAGASLGPFLAGSIVSLGDRPWYYWYYALSLICIVEFALLAFAFRLEDSSKYRVAKLGSLSGDSKVAQTSIFKHVATWICAAYFLIYVGTEASVTGWIVVFMTRARHMSPYLASIWSCLFGIGMAAGRLSLGFITDRAGVRVATVAYLISAIGLQILFILVEVPVISGIVITCLGFFLGPLFPSGIVMIIRILPENLHVAAVSFVASIGQLGGALLPFAIGTLAEHVGIQVFQIIILTQLVAVLCIWLCFPRLSSVASIVESD